MPGCAPRARGGVRRRSATLILSCFIAAASLVPAAAVDRDVYKEIRGRYEGMMLRLRVDLKVANQATSPNRISLEGIGYGRESAPVLFGAMERVFLDRITSEGGTRLGITLYRDEEGAARTRAMAIPQPSMANPNFGRTVAAFAQLDSTSLVLELKASKKDPAAQLAEIETLVGRAFYLTEPTREEFVRFVREHARLPLKRLQSLTGLPPEEIRAIQIEVTGSQEPHG